MYLKLWSVRQGPGVMAPTGLPVGNQLQLVMRYDMILKSVVMPPRILHRNFQKSGSTELASMHRKEKIKLIIF